MKDRISVCMIVKNEEALLPQCLESIKDIAYEIVVVDTGSTDSTVDIAKSYGAKVYFSKWQGSFAQARNVSLSKATGDWIFIIDADEKLSKESIPIIKDIIKKDKGSIIGYRAKNINVLDDDNPQKSVVEHFNIRLFRNKKNIFYISKVHNQLVFKTHNQKNEEVILPLDGVDTDIVIYHYGYLKEVFNKKNKFERSSKLIKDILKKNPYDSFQHYNLANLYLSIKEYKNALKHYLLAVKYGRRDLGYFFAAKLYAAIAYLQLKDYDNAEKFLFELLEDKKDNPDVYFHLGLVYYRKGENKKALLYFKKAIKNKDKVSFITDKGNYTWKPYIKMAEIYYHDKELRDLHKALFYFKKGYRFVKEPDILLIIGDIYKDLKDLDNAYRFYYKYIKETSNCTNLKILIEVLLYNGFSNSKKLLNLVNKCKGIDKDKLIDILLFVSDFFFSKSQIDKSLTFLKYAYKLDKNNIVILRKLASLYFMKEDFSKCYRLVKDLEDDSILNLKLECMKKLKYYNKLIDILQSRKLNKELKFFLANIFIEKEKYQDALPLLKDVEIQAPSNIDVLYSIATCYINLDDRESAKKYLYRVLQIAPQHLPSLLTLQGLQLVE